jgi:hypothetical protein
MNQISRAILQN